VAACSLQPYYSALNKFFRDHQRPPIAVGELLADARRGLEMLQRRLVPADKRLPLLAPVTLDILLAPNTLRDNLAWSPAALPLLPRFRACLAVCVTYTFFQSRRNRRPLPDRGPHRRPTLSAILSVCPQVQRGPTPQHPRQTRAQNPDTRETHLSQPPRLLHTATLHFLHNILQAPTPFHFLELLTCRSLR
jgi:hypothetical protein